MISNKTKKYYVQQNLYCVLKTSSVYIFRFTFYYKKGFNFLMEIKKSD